MMAARGFWSTYTWEHIAAQYGVDLFNDKWEPVFNSDAGVKALETILALQKNAAEGVAGWGWGENRAAWLGGQLAINISWQDSGTQATRPDQSKIVGDVLTIYEPRVEGGRFAPPNIAGSTSGVTATSKNPEGAFLMLAFLTTASIMAMNEANANGVAPGYRSVLTNPNLRKVSQPAEVWANELDYCLVRAAPARHVRDGAGARQRDQQGGRRPDDAEGSSRCRRQGLARDHGQERLLSPTSRPSISPPWPMRCGWARARRRRSDRRKRLLPMADSHVSRQDPGRAAKVARSAYEAPAQPVCAQGLSLSSGRAGGDLPPGDHALSRPLRHLSEPLPRPLQQLDLHRARQLQQALRRPGVLGEPVEHLPHGLDRPCARIRHRAGLAALAYRDPWIRSWRILFLLPMLFMPSAVSFIWKLAFNDGRVVSDLLMRIGLIERPLDFLGNVWLARLSLIITDVWQWTPFLFIIFVAALQSQDAEIEEAARLDGARWPQIFWNISLADAEADHRRGACPARHRHRDHVHLGLHHHRRHAGRRHRDDELFHLPHRLQALRFRLCLGRFRLSCWS